ncbi:hypothetical protein [Bifidobacterium breve]|uniref:hypothetical protein n=1 Tax=Bifidobacterium breve TaxID=1685 RepID=UPI001E655EF9|nr:hypothetical protein [Bifidobacterium breve]
MSSWWAGPIVDVRDVGEFVDIIVCPVIGHAVAVSCAAVDAHLQDEVVNVLGKTFQVFLDRRPCLVFLPIFGGDSTLIVVLPVAFASLFSLWIAASLYPAEFLCKRKQCSGVSRFRCDLRFFSVSLLFYRFIHVLFCNRLFSDADDSFQNEYSKIVLEN